ncbi:MAG: hypothetical protein M9961_14355 [Ilumatobacteraceae bacterium]|nr:hypothetical protein [Ilumatobacteraceae bacterium]
MNSSLEDRLITYYDRLTTDLPNEGPGLDAVSSVRVTPRAASRSRRVRKLVPLGAAAAVIVIGLVVVTQRPTADRIGRSTPQTSVPSATVGSTAPPTSSSASATSVVEAAGAPDIAKGTMFGFAPMNAASPEDAIALLRPSLGEVTWDTNWQPMPADFACTGNDSYRTVWWGDLRMTFESNSSVTLLTAWSVGAAPTGAPLGPLPPTSLATGIETAEGVRIGLTVSEVLGIFPGLTYDDNSQSIQVVSSSGLATMLYFDTSQQLVGFGSSRNDCAPGS